MGENIVRINYREKEIYLIKTAHVSKSSAEDVQAAFEEIQPDTICIELDEQRYDNLKNPDRWRNQDIVSVIKNKQVGYLLVNIILASFQKRMAKSMDSTSGAEMKLGMELAEQNQRNLVLADRNIKTTFSRIWNKLGIGEKAKLLSGIIMSIFEDEDISEEELEKLKEADALEAALSEVGKEFPIVKKVLVDERDQYLSMKIKNAPGKKIMAVIGAAHANGIVRSIENEYDLKELADTGKKKSAASLIKWLIPLLIVAMIIYTIFHNRDVGIEQIRTWIFCNGLLSAFGALLALAHPLSILTAFIMAPITSLNPLLAAGWFAGLTEAYLRKPKVADFENLTEDTASLRGFFKNRVTRILLLVIFANLFSTIGTFISGLSIVRSFFGIL